jgi:hypothetical protein
MLSAAGCLVIHFVAVTISSDTFKIPARGRRRKFENELVNQTITGKESQPSTPDGNRRANIYNHILKSRQTIATIAPGSAFRSSQASAPKSAPGLTTNPTRTR